MSCNNLSSNFIMVDKVKSLIIFHNQAHIYLLLFLFNFEFYDKWV